MPRDKINETRSINGSQSFFEKGLSRLGVRSKIACGYLAILSIIIVGIITGRTIEQVKQNEAQQHFELANQRVLKLKNIQHSLLEIQIHTRTLPIILADDIQRFEADYQHILKYGDIKLEQNQNLRGDRPVVLTQIEPAIAEYLQALEALVLPLLNSPPQTPQALSAAQQEISIFADSQVALNLDNLIHDLDAIISDLQNEQKQAWLDLQQAEEVGAALVLASLILAISVAVILLLYISNAIARPLQQVTQVTRKVTQESDFTLQAPVTTEDEVGELTLALNQLIRSIYDYTNELKSTQSQLIQTEKMSSLGQMVAGIAHEINNPVGFIYGNIVHAEENIKDLLYLIELYQQEYPNPSEEIAEEIAAIDLEFTAEDLPKILNSMRMGTERISEIVVSLRNFSRVDSIAVKAINLHEGLDSTLIILQNRLKTEIKVIKNYGELPLVECYPSQLNQVWMNLINNAIDALEEEKAKNPAFQPEIKITTEVGEGDRVLVNIQDNGPGIPPEIQAKIFEAFYTTKPIGKGTGLGLSICASIIEKHQGQVSIESQPQQGTKFAIALPVTQTETALTPAV